MNETETRPVLEGFLETTVAQLEELSEEQLYMLIGSASLNPIEATSAAIYSYAPSDAPELERRQLVARLGVDLPSRGRRTVERIIVDGGHELRERLCRLWEKNPDRTNLATGIAVVLCQAFGLWPGILAAIAVLIAKYYIDKLCREGVDAVARAIAA